MSTAVPRTVPAERRALTRAGGRFPATRMPASDSRAIRRCHCSTGVSAGSTRQANALPRDQAAPPTTRPGAIAKPRPASWYPVTLPRVGEHERRRDRADRSTADDVRHRRRGRVDHLPLEGARPLGGIGGRRRAVDPQAPRERQRRGEVPAPPRDALGTAPGARVTVEARPQVERRRRDRRLEPGCEQDTVRVGRQRGRDPRASAAPIKANRMHPLFYRVTARPETFLRSGPVRSSRTIPYMTPSSHSPRRS